MKKYILICFFILSACKSITYQDINPQILPNENLLPAMESIVDMSNLEATYTAGYYNGSANNLGTGIGNSSWIQTTAISGTNYKDARVNDVINVFEKEIIYLLRKMSIEEIANLADVSEGLEFAIKNAANSCNSIVEFLHIIQSKRYTNTRLQRILLYALLGITKKDMLLSKKITPYLRVLGFNERGKFLISEASKANPKLEIVTSVKKYMDHCSNKNLKLMLEKDIWATNVYTIGYEYDSWSNLDYTKKIITK